MSTNNANAVNPEVSKWVIGAIAAFALLPGIGIFVAIFCLSRAFKAFSKVTIANKAGKMPAMQSLLEAARNAANETAGTMQEAAEAYQQGKPQQGARRTNKTRRRKAAPAPAKKALPKPDTPLVQEGFRIFGRRPSS